jgi:hypothetical protein
MVTSSGKGQIYLYLFPNNGSVVEIISSLLNAQFFHLTAGGVKKKSANFRNSEGELYGLNAI